MYFCDSLNHPSVGGVVSTVGGVVSTVGGVVSSVGGVVSTVGGVAMSLATRGYNRAFKIGSIIY